MPSRPSSKRWLRRQEKDPFVRRAQSEGWRSRAVFKLVEIQSRDRMLSPGQVVLDLGAAPGAWSQYAHQLVGAKGAVIAVDMLEIQPLEGVVLTRGDFTEADTVEQVIGALGGARIDLVMSDMAPNISGRRSVDQPRAMYLAELALQFARDHLKTGGGIIIKLFHGEGFDAFVKETRREFAHVKVRKPEASRAGSRETYLIAKDYGL